MAIRSLPKERYPEIVKELESRFALGQEANHDPEEVMSFIVHEMGGLYGGVTSVACREMFFFRVRPRSHFSDPTDLFEKSQHSYPPAEFCTSHGRCNIPGHPVFYCSDSHDCAIAEMKSPEEEDYVLSFWRLPARTIYTAKFLCATNLSTGRLLEHKTKILQDSFEQSGMSDELNCGRLKAFMEAWSDLFLSEEYCLSSAIAYRLLYGAFRGGQDMIGYGSAFDNGYMNFALPTRLADELELVRIFNVKTRLDKQTTWVSYWEPNSEKIWNNVTPDSIPYLDARVKYGIL